MLKKNDIELIFDVTVKTSSQRYPVFKNNQKCVCCGLEASFLAIEKKLISKTPIQNYHINMYGMKDGKEILFTKDHIIPKSKGGKNFQNNYQTMCVFCNIKKGNSII